jgi:hypothetical protein
MAEEGHGHEDAVAAHVKELGWLFRIKVSLCAKRRTPHHLQLSSPSKIPGIPTKSNGIPSSASASILSG